jgi:hypothetical protein
MIKYLVTASGNTWGSTKVEHSKYIRVRDELLGTKFKKYVLSEDNGNTNTLHEDGTEKWGHHSYYNIDNQWITVEDFNALKEMGVDIQKKDFEVFSVPEKVSPMEKYLFTLTAYAAIVFTVWLFQ